MFTISNMAFPAIVTVLLALAGCTPAVQMNPIAIDDTRYEPAMERYPASVGVYLPDDFFEHNFVHVTNDGYQHTFHSNPANGSLWAVDLALETIFSEVRYLDTLQEGLDAADLAFVVVPNIASMTADLAPEVIAVRLAYQFEFFADGEHIYSWRISGRDSLSRSSIPAASMVSGPVYQDVRPRAVSAEKFDAVARGAVWDAIAVFLAELNRQGPLSDRLPAPLVNGSSVDTSRWTAADPVTLALVGPVFDQDQEPEKQRLEDCLIEEIRDNGLSLKAVSLHNLRNRLYPWLSRSNYPERLNDLELMIKKSAVRQRLLEMGVQYVLNWTGETTIAPAEGQMYITPYGMIGYKSKVKTSVIKADLLTVEDGRVMTSFESVQEGTDYMLGLVFLPLPISADTEEEACEELTRQVDHFIQINAQLPQENR
jgi:hypothetical protein